MLSWLMFIASGIGPFSGQSVHFKHYAPEPVPYAINRYDFGGLAALGRSSTRTSPTAPGWRATPTRCSTWPCGAGRAPCLLRSAPKPGRRLPNVKRLFDAVNARPAAQRAAALKDRYTFKAEMDAEAQRAMFPQNERLKG